ncbi:MAG TPA: SDR family NAD(P)-dependent oxidoreductase [Candidatus Acidoferrales bacterium]|nr:SDR family NAD(P)-dependent oxidoreductase [Candidatus Acidoferrales bacterium]
MKNSAIAIVGMAGRFPGARTIAAFWRNLRDGVESIRELSDAELIAAGVSRRELANPDYVRAAAVLSDVDKFDASFFGFSPKDAAIMDPQHRHFLECAWEAIESAGHVPDNFPGSIGVFAGSGMNAYMIHNLLANRALAESAGLFLIRQTGNDKDVLATRASYQLNLRGPSISVQTACSTSLVAVHLACQSLLNCECDMALAGGVTIEIPHARGYIYREGEILSRDGHCRSFDASSSGTIFSSGVGLVVLRRLEDALEDRDTIHAVILGSAINNDGSRKIGYLAPSVDGQAEVVAEALGVAGVAADDISYVETHGTGTAVGDPIEIKALTQAFRQTTQRTGFCAIGSLKSSVGHMDAAAGVGGLIKATLALEHKKIPASLHFEKPNPLIDFANSPFYVNTELADWKSRGPRRAGVTSLGIGGTNAHVILEEAPAAAPAPSARPYQLLVLSAKTESALARAAENMAGHFESHPEVNFADVAFTSQVGRKEFAHRLAFPAADAAEAIAALRDANGSDAKRVASGVAPSAAPSVVFLFSGQGSQHVNMGAELYRTEPVFRAALDKCAELLRPHLDLDLRDLLYPASGGDAEASERLNRTCIAQPALFAVEYALAQWWISCGVVPRAMIGHSIGEYVAACLAGVFSLEEGIEITAVRGRLMQQMDPGAMLSVPLAAEEIEVGESLSIAAVNAPGQTVVSGPIPAIEALEKRLAASDIAWRRLHTSHAFHSAMMEPMLERFRRHMQRIGLRAPAIPFVSNLSGTWIAAEQAASADYWTAHVRNTVRFSDCVREVFRQPGRVLLEVGPGQALASLARQHPERNDAKVLVSARHPQERTSDAKTLLAAVAQLWTCGQPIHWDALHSGQPRGRVPLPSYPFEHRRYWIEPDANTRAEEPRENSAAEPAAANRIDSADRWFQRRAWLRTAIPAAVSGSPGRWLLFAEESALSSQVVAQLSAAGHRAIRVTPGKSYARRNPAEYTLRPGVRADYDLLLADLAAQGGAPQKMVHLWSVRKPAEEISTDQALDRSFYSLLFLLQAMGDQDWTSFDLAVISNGLHAVPGDPAARNAGDPVRAALLGPVKVAPKEFPGITCRNIDFAPDVNGHRAAAQIIAELSSGSAESVIAYRGDSRWTESFEIAEQPAAGKPPLRERGVYMITGGFGGIGLAIAEHLARECKARLVLIGRTPLPAQKDWASIAGNGAPEKMKRLLQKLLEIQSAGAELLPVQADVTRKEEMELAVREALRRFGAIHGVIHAAGAIEDRPVQTKTRESAARVLGPKVHGSLVLKKVLEGVPLDFMALFSSVSSLVPPAGQVDYAAANAVLDSIASSEPAAPVIAINWGLWRGVGMGARAAASHPLLDRRLVESRDETIYAADLSCDEHWVLSGHRLKQGMAMLPGTGYLEMAAAAFHRGSFGAGFEFEDVFFLSPLSCDPGHSKEVRVRLQREHSGTRFTVFSKDAEWVENASGQIAERSAAQPPARDLAEIRARCRLREIVFDDTRRTRQETYFQFGPRWRNLRTLHLGAGEALADLDLAADFREDAAEYLLHPALLDLATGSALYLVPEYEGTESLYLPLSYKKLVLYAPLPPKFYSHIRARARNTSQGAIASFDITLLSPDGTVLAEIEEFSMRRLAEPAAAGKAAQSSAVTARAQAQLQSQADGAFDVPGIPAAQGVHAFVRAVSGAFGREVIVAPEPLIPVKNASSPALAQRESRQAATGDEVEQVLAGWWRELLGGESISPDDDFFDLGGHSLIAVRLFSKIKKTYRLDLNLSTLFEARTIRQLSKLIRQVGTPEVEARSWSPVVSIQRQGARLPLFVISGLGGNVLNFSRLGSHLGQEQPVYALQPQGLDGRRPFLTRVEDMAAFYIREIKAIQPEGPYQLAGYSFGGFVAFEMAQQLRAAGDQVGLLGLLDTIEWHYLEQIKQSLRPKERLALYKARFDQVFFEDGGATYLKDRLRTVSSRFVYRLFRALGRPLPQSVGTIQDINSFAAAVYKPRVYPGALTIFRSTTREMLDGSDELLGWRGLAAAGIEVRDVPGTHHNMTREPNVRILAEKMRECLDRSSRLASAAPSVSPQGDRIASVH